MTTANQSAVEIIEVGPRDGLQNESVQLSTANKLAMIQALLDAGAKRLEVTSFVHPRWVPQMADAEAVCAALPELDDVIYVGLILNQRGLDRALATGRLHELGCVAVATDGFGQANQNQSWRESVATSKDLIRQTRAAGLRAQVTISVAFGCPFEGEVPSQRVVDIAADLATAQPFEIALADTIGVAAPQQVRQLVAAVREVVDPAIALRCHFHNTRNTGYANAYAALLEGVERFDSSIAGLGGCPFAPRATGNIGTEDLAYQLHRMGRPTGLDLDRLIQTSQHIEGWLGRPVAAMLSRAGDFPGALANR